MSKYHQDFWNERYNQKEFVYGEKPNEYLKAKLDSLPVGKILFAAEGEGRNAVYAAKNGWQATAFDQSEEGKKKADILAKSNNVQIDYTVSEVENISYPEKHFDALALVYAHFHSEKRKKYHQELSSYLKNGGVLILEAFGKSQMENQLKNPAAGGPKDPNMLYDIEELKSDFEGFEFIEQNTLTINLSEGDYHTGEAAVLRIFATKNNTIMKKNMGTIDKTIRTLVAVVIGILYFTNVISGTLAIILGILAVVFVLTSLISFCPLYLPFGINTFKNKKQ